MMKDIMMDIISVIVKIIDMVMLTVAIALVALILLAEGVVNVSRTTQMPVGKLNGYTVYKDVEISYNDMARDICYNIGKAVDEFNR